MPRLTPGDGASLRLVVLPLVSYLAAIMLVAYGVLWLRLVTRPQAERGAGVWRSSTTASRLVALLVGIVLARIIITIAFGG